MIGQQDKACIRPLPWKVLRFDALQIKTYRKTRKNSKKFHSFCQKSVNYTDKYKWNRGSGLEPMIRGFFVWCPAFWIAPVFAPVNLMAFFGWSCFYQTHGWIWWALKDEKMKNIGTFWSSGLEIAVIVCLFVVDVSLFRFLFACLILSIAYK